MSTIRTQSFLNVWLAGAAAQFGDPSEPICQLLVRWEGDLPAYTGDDLVAGMVDGRIVLRLQLGDETVDLPLPIETGQSRSVQLYDDGPPFTFGAQLLASGVWTLDPSLNLPGLIHGFVVLYGVPDPAPWEDAAQRIIVPGLVIAR